jgi:hypothetical protein
VSARACRIFLWFWMLGLTSCSFTNPPRRGGPLRPPVLTELFLGTKCCGFTAYPLSAFTKTTGMTTNIHRVLGSRNRGNTLFCLVPDRLTPPVVYASALHRTRRSARDVGLLDDETCCWRSCRCMKTPRRGGPLCPPVLTELFLGTKCCGFTACPLSAFTKTTGMTTNIHRVLGSRNRGNEMFCLVNVWRTPPVVYASGLHRTRRSARDVGLLDDETRCWQSCRCMKILCVGADRCVRPCLPDFPLVLDVRLHFVFSSKSSV